MNANNTMIIGIIWIYHLNLIMLVQRRAFNLKKGSTCYFSLQYNVSLYNRLSYARVLIGSHL